MVPDLAEIKAQHCTTVLFTDYYSELNGYRGFTKEVLFCCFFLKTNFVNFKSISPVSPSVRVRAHTCASRTHTTHTHNVVMLPSNKRSFVLRLFKKCNCQVHYLHLGDC